MTYRFIYLACHKFYILLTPDGCAAATKQPPSTARSVAESSRSLPADISQ